MKSSMNSFLIKFYSVAFLAWIVFTGTATDALAQTVIAFDDPGHSSSDPGDWLGGIANGASHPGIVNQFYQSAAGNGATSTWDFTGLANGQYFVAVDWATLINRTTVASYDISDGGGTVVVDQQNDIDRNFVTMETHTTGWPASTGPRPIAWELLTPIPVTVSDGTLSVTLSDDDGGVGAGTFLMASAVWIDTVLPAPHVPSPTRSIIDDLETDYLDSGFFGGFDCCSYGGPTSTTVTGSDSRFTVAGGGENTASWTFTGLTPGTPTSVSITWSASTNRVSDAPFTVSGILGGDQTFDIDQLVQPDPDFVEVDALGSAIAFQELGIFTPTSTSLTVSLNNDSADAGSFVIADAVRIDSTGPPIEVTLRTTVNRDTGNIKIENNTNDPIAMVGYSLESAEKGGVSETNWTSIADNYDSDAPGPGTGTVDPDDTWNKLSASGGFFDLSEAEFFGDGASVASLQVIDLGDGAWIRSPFESDLVFSFLAPDGTVITAPIFFEGNGDEAFAFGDLNFDGTAFGLDDFTDEMLPNLVSTPGSPSPAVTYGLGDLDGDLDVDGRDFRLFKEGFLAAGGALAALQGALVPEPSSLALVSLLCLGMVCRSARRSVSPRVMVVLIACLASLGTFSRASAQIIALDSPAPLAGNQDFIGGFGMDFVVVDKRVTVSDLGYFDSNQDGIVGVGTQIDVSIWERDDNGTLNDFSDDTGVGIVAGTTSFTFGSDGTLDGGSRFGSISNVTLNPGAYTIVAFGFGTDDLAGNTGTSTDPEDPLPPPSTINTAGGVLDFVGFGRFGGTGFPPNVDSGPPNRYHAGTFKYDLSADELLLEINTVSGAMSILNEGTGDFALDFYEITSGGNSLDNTWDGLAGSIAGWTTGGASNAGSLSEANLAGSTLFGAAASESLGNGYDTGVDAQDLVFSYAIADGTEFVGQIRYVSGSFNVADFNEDGIVDDLDLGLWETGYGTVGSAGHIDGDANGDMNVDGADFLLWQENLGATSLAASTTVPEPSGGLLMCLAGAALLGFKRRLDLKYPAARSVALSASIVLCATLAVARPADAASTIARDYRFENNTTDSSAAGTDLTATGGPAFIDITTTSANLLQVRPFAAEDSSTFGIEMDGSDDFLRGPRLGQPASSVDSLLNGGTIDYDLINDRGFQLWVYADSAGSGTEQDVVLDTEQHGLRISSDDTWVMRYNGVDNDSEVPVTFDEWSHVMVVKPDTANRSEMYIDGSLAAITGGGYDVSDDAELVVGANTDAVPANVGASGFFNGVLDDLEEFVFGVSGLLVIDYGSYVFAEDNDFASKMLTGVDGDVNLDTVLDSTDIDAMAAGWLNTKVVDGIQLGDLETRMLGDLNFDGSTDLLDVFELRSAFAAALITLEDDAWDAFTANVPEPASGTMLLVAGLGLGLWRNRNRGRK